MTVQALPFQLVQARSPLETAKDCPVGQPTGPRLVHTRPPGTCRRAAASSSLPGNRCP